MFAAILTIWSNPTREKLIDINSTIGFKPAAALPIPAPINPASEIGVSLIRSGPYFSKKPEVIAYAPP